MVKKIFCSLITLLSVVAIVQAYDCANKLPLPGGTIASEDLQKESLFTVYAFANRVAPQGCTNFAIIDTEVSEPKANDKWQEIWTVKACSKTARIPINFEVKQQYNVYAIDPMGVRVTESK